MNTEKKYKEVWTSSADSDSANDEFADRYTPTGDESALNEALDASYGL